MQNICVNFHFRSMGREIADTRDTSKQTYRRICRHGIHIRHEEMPCENNGQLNLHKK